MNAINLKNAMKILKVTKPAMVNVEVQKALRP